MRYNQNNPTNMEQSVMVHGEAVQMPHVVWFERRARGKLKLKIHSL